MEILVQKIISDIKSITRFTSFSIGVLSIEDVILALSDIVDDTENGYYRLPFITSKSEGMERLDIYTSLRKERADQAYIFSNGRNTIYVLNYKIKKKRVYNDPIVYIAGPDALEIAQHVSDNLTETLLSKMYEIRLNEEAISIFSKLKGYDEFDVIRKMNEIIKEMKIGLKIRLLGNVGKDRKLYENKNLTGKILEEINNKNNSDNSADTLNRISSSEIIVYLLIFSAILFLLLIGL